MKKARLALRSAAVFGASLCGVSSVSAQAVTFLADQTPSTAKADGSGNWGEDYTLISSVVVTTGYEDIQSASTNVPANHVTAPAIFFQINLNPGTVAFPTNITLNSNSNPNNTSDIGQWWADYDIMMETIPGAGIVSTPTTVHNAYPYAGDYGISTGENYFINGFNDKVTSPSTTGGNQVYNYSGAWSQVAGVGQATFNATSTVISATSMTYGIPLSDLGLTVGQSLKFDAYSGFGGLPFDALDNANWAGGYQPYTGSGTTAPAAYDSATAAGSTLSTYVVAIPTMTWNNSFAAAGFTDGITWDISDTSKYNWNNGLFADYYVDGDNVVFNDVNNATSNGGTNASAYSVTLNTAVAPGSVVVSNNLGNYTISGTGSIGGTASLTKSGTGTLSLSTANTYSGGTTVNAGVLQILPTSPLSTTLSALPKGALTITGSGIVQLATNVTLGSQSNPTPASNVNITSLSISGNGTLDINNNHIIVDYTPGNDPISSIVAWIDSGAHVTAGVATWTGTGITSTAAAANAGSYGIGYADAADPGNPAHLAAGQIEVMYTLLGDANLDGKVNGTDFNILATNFNTGGDSWDQGDFTYDGKVNGSDFNLLAQNFNQGATQAANEAALTAFDSANGISPVSVPEPASGALAAMLAVGVLQRRLRSRRE